MIHGFMKILNQHIQNYMIFVIMNKYICFVTVVGLSSTYRDLAASVTRQLIPKNVVSHSFAGLDILVS